MNLETYDLIIIGGGAAGLMAAGTAAACGCSVCLLEKMEKPARKVRITGKGRCNITNTKPHDEFLSHVYPDSRFFNPALRNFSNMQTIDFFNSIGVETEVERGERVFPKSGRAWDVADALANWAKKCGAEIVCNAKVDSLNVSNSEVQSVSLFFENRNETISAKYFLIATGGKSYPLTGSTGDGYDFAKQAGHTITNLLPSLVPLEVKNHDTRLNGLQLKNVALELWVDGGKVADEFGEMEFNATGVTGAIVLRLSRDAVSAVDANKRVDMHLDLKPALTFIQLENRIARESETAKNVEALLLRMLPKQMLLPFAQHAKVDLKAMITPNVVKNIIDNLKCWSFEIDCSRGFAEAIVTAGGVSLKEINFKTMQSKLVKNLYFAGEVLDIDANTGGYNLQIAFSTARLAAENIAKQIKIK